MTSDVTHPSFLLIIAAIVTAVLIFVRSVLWALVFLLVDLVCIAARSPFSRTSSAPRSEPLRSDDR